MVLMKYLDVNNGGIRRSYHLVTMSRQLSTSVGRRNESTWKDGKPRKTHWQEQIKLLNNINRALAHYDDFYGNVFGRQWPSLRLALLSQPKYMAIPNPFTGNIEQICDKLHKMGSYNIQTIWREQKALFDEERKEIDMNKDLGRLHKLDLTLESIAATKRAEELDILYQNAPTSKREELQLAKNAPGRVISDISKVSSEFIPSSKMKGLDDFTFDSEYFTSYLQKHENEDDDEDGTGSKKDESLQDVNFLKSSKIALDFPKLLVPHGFESGSSLMFPPARRDNGSNLREYICVNGASILPIIALDCKPGCNLLDMCAGPGTKSLMCLMTMSLNTLICNDVESSRLARVKKMFTEFTGSENPPNVLYTKYNGRDYPGNHEFSRVLVDVPCLNDRVSCTVSDNNIFKTSRTKERLALVTTQREILLSGFKSLEKSDGSTIVYSTCTLSPIENDGVVMNALKETGVQNLHIDLIGLVKLLAPFERVGLFRIMRTRCGVLVMPSVVSNFGPMYVSRVVVHSTAEELTSPEDITNITHDKIQNTQ